MAFLIDIRKISLDSVLATQKFTIIDFVTLLEL